jgi:hypothetical protein
VGPRTTDQIVPGDNLREPVTAMEEAAFLLTVAWPAGAGASEPKAPISRANPNGLIEPHRDWQHSPVQLVPPTCNAACTRAWAAGLMPDARGAPRKCGPRAES